MSEAFTSDLRRTLFTMLGICLSVGVRIVYSVIGLQMVATMNQINGLVIVMVFTLAFASCKKAMPINIPEALIGTWHEQPPCVAGTGSCFAFQLTKDSTYIESSPYGTTGAYMLSKNNDSITFTGALGLGGAIRIQFVNSTELILCNYYTPVNGNLTFTPAENVTLMKMN